MPSPAPPGLAWEIDDDHWRQVIDVNLSGANGILVNITAGPDFTMAEFDEVGRTIEAFASEDATVVIGTVLDPEMADEVRVTVVATGLGELGTLLAVLCKANGVLLPMLPGLVSTMYPLSGRQWLAPVPVLGQYALARSREDP